MTDCLRESRIILGNNGSYSSNCCSTKSPKWYAYRSKKTQHFIGCNTIYRLRGWLCRSFRYSSPVVTIDFFAVWMIPTTKRSPTHNKKSYAENFVSSSSSRTRWSNVLLQPRYASRTLSLLGLPQRMKLRHKIDNPIRICGKCNIILLPLTVSWRSRGCQSSRFPGRSNMLVNWLWMWNERAKKTTTGTHFCPSGKCYLRQRGW